MLDAGAVSYLVKGSPNVEITTAIRNAAEPEGRTSVAL